MPKIDPEWLMDSLEDLSQEQVAEFLRHADTETILSLLETLEASEVPEFRRKLRLALLQAGELPPKG